MTKELIPGIKGTLSETVVFDKTAASVGSGLIEVYATPAMIALMENTANQLVQDYLGEGENTVGSEVNIKHVKPTPIGMQVSCEATVVAVEGRKITFEVKAWDEQGDIGLGVHTRFIINTEKFMQKLVQ
ncbi:MAG: thioesterase family protein [Cyclobacteriaceae bacterium]